MAYPRFVKSRNHTYIIDESANGAQYDISSTSFVPMSTDTNDSQLDLTIPADQGDVLECSLNFHWSGESVLRYAEICTIEDGDEISYFGGTHGISGLHAHASYTAPVAKSSNAYHTVIPADFGPSYMVIVRPLAKVGSGSSGVQASVDYPFVFSVKNLGPIYTP